MTRAIATVLLTTWLLGCGSREPVPSGSQSIDAIGSGEKVGLLLAGPEGVRGPITPSDPAYFTVQVHVNGPALGMAYVSVDNPHPGGCNFSAHLPAYLALDASGEAEVEARVTFWAAQACSFDIHARAASDYEGEYKDPDTDEFRSFVLKGDIDTAHAQITFRNLGAS